LDKQELRVGDITAPKANERGFIANKEMLIANGAGWQLYHPGRTISVVRFPTDQTDEIVRQGKIAK